MGRFYPLVRGVDKQIFRVVILLKERGGKRVGGKELGVRGIEMGEWKENDGKK